MFEIRAETRQAVRLLVGAGLTSLLAIAYGVYVTRRLGSGAVGEFAHALSIVAFLQLALGPINGTVARFSARGGIGQARALVREVARRVAGYGLLALLVGLIAAVPLARFWRYGSPAPLFVALSVAYLMVLLSIPRGALRGRQAFGSLNVSTISEAGLRFLIGVPLLFWWATATAGLLPYLGALTLTLALSARQLRGLWGDAPAEPLDGGAVRRFVLQMLLLMAGYAAFQNVDMLIVKRIFSSDLADAYGIAFYITGRAMAVLAAPFATLMLPLIAGSRNTDAEDRHLVLRVSSVFVGLSAMALALFALWPEAVLRALYGQRFLISAPLLLPLAVTRFVGHLSQLIALASAAAGRFGFLRIYLGGLCVQVVLLVSWTRTPAQVTTVLVVVQSAVLLLMALQFLVRRGTDVSSGAPRD